MIDMGHKEYKVVLRQDVSKDEVAARKVMSESQRKRMQCLLTVD